MKSTAMQAGAYAAVTADPWGGGGPECTEMAEAVVAACEEESTLELLYPPEQSIQKKITTIATEIYGASGIELSAQARKQIASYEANGFGSLPICVAETHLSTSHDPSPKGAPTGYILPVREVRASVGAGFIYPIVGAMRTMPGLGARPAFMNVDVNEDGQVVGLF